MGATTQESPWALARRQYNVVARWQLLALGYSSKAIKHRLRSGRLHRTPWRGVYAVGHPNLTRRGFLMAAVLASGEGAGLIDASAAELWGVRGIAPGPIHVVVPNSRRAREGIVLHQRPRALVVRHGIPVTSIVDTLIDIRATEADVIEADKLDLIHVGPLRRALETTPPRPGVKRLQRLIDRHIFTFTDSELERWFLPIARRVGLGRVCTQVWLNGRLVDFYFEELGIVIETDGGRFHRTAMQQTRDRQGEHVHYRAGLEPLRFTHGQIRYDPEDVEETLRVAKARRIALAA